MFYIIICLVLLFCLSVSNINATVQFTFKHQFSPSSFNNPAQPSTTLNDTITSISFLFDSSSGTSKGDGINGFELDIEVVSSTGTIVPAKMHVTYTPELIIRGKRIMGLIAQKIITVTSIIRQDRTKSWFVNTGNIQMDLNSQQLLDLLFPIGNSTGSGGGSRRLLAKQILDEASETLEEKLTRIGHVKHKFLYKQTRKLVKHTKQYDQFIEKHDHIRRILNDTTHQVNKLHQLHQTNLYHHIQKMKPGFASATTTPSSHQQGKGRGLLGIVDQPPNDPSIVNPNPVILSPPALHDLDQLRSQSKDFMDNQDLFRSGSIAYQGAKQIDQLATLVNKVNKNFATDFTVISNLSRVTGPEFLSFQEFINATHFAQIEALAAVAESNQLLNNRTDYFLQDNLAAMKELQTSVNNLQLTDDPFYNATTEIMQTINHTINVITDYLKVNGKRLQSLYTLEGYLNRQLINFYTETNIRYGKTAKEHEMNAILEAAGYQVVKGTVYQSQEPLGLIPLNDVNVGYFYRFTWQATTNIPRTSALAEAYDDQDMYLVPDYRAGQSQASNNYLAALQANDAIQATASTGGSWFLNYRQISVFCKNEYVFPLKNEWTSLQDIVTLIGPKGCTPEVNCNCWVQIKRQRCGTVAPLNNTPPSLRDNVWSSGGKNKKQTILKKS